MYDPNKAHDVVVTGIIVNNGKFLIAKRSPTEKAFPNQWTVPGEKLLVSINEPWILVLSHPL